MDIEEWQSFTQDKFAALDVVEAEVKALHVLEEEETPGFGRDSKC